MKKKTDWKFFTKLLIWKNWRSKLKEFILTQTVAISRVKHLWTYVEQLFEIESLLEWEKSLSNHGYRWDIHNWFFCEDMECILCQYDNRTLIEFHPVVNRELESSFRDLPLGLKFLTGLKFRKLSMKFNKSCF